MLYKGGHTVGAGTYWNTATGERIEAMRELVLPGDEQTIYIRAKSALVLIAGPVLGLAFAVFLPFIGIVMTLGRAGKKIADSAIGQAAKSVSFGWLPVEAYLAGRAKRKAEKARKEKK